MWYIVPLICFISGTKGFSLLAVNNRGLSLYNMTSGQQASLMVELELREVDYHYRRGEVYGLNKRQILRCPLWSSSPHEYQTVVYSQDEYNFMSMCVDWVHDTIYWTGGPVFMIHRASLDGTGHKIILRGYYIETFHKKLLVDPNAGLLIWASSKQIFRADLNGNDLQEIQFPEVVGTIMSRVKNIALDATTNRIYFLAGFEGDDIWVMMSGRYDGTDFRRHDSVNRFTYAIAAMGPEVYWVGKEAVGSFQRSQALSLYRGSTQVLGSHSQITQLQADGIWNMKICDAGFQVTDPQMPQTQQQAQQVA